MDRWRLMYVLSNRGRVAASLAAATLLLFFPACDRVGSQTFDQHVQNARVFQDKGELRASIIELKNALQQNPDSAEARLLLGEIYVAVRDGVSAEKELSRARKLGADGESSKIMLGQALLLQESYTRILEEIEPDPGASPKDVARIQQLRAEAQFGLGHPEQACDLLEQSVRVDSTYVPVYWGLARCAAIREDFQYARTLLERALELEARNAETWIWLGKLAQMTSDFKAAEAAFSSALEISQDHVEAYQNLVFLYLATGEYDKARTQLGAARKFAPKNLRLLYLQGLLNFREKNYTEARDNLLEVLKSAPDDTPSLLLSGVVFHELGSFQQAIQNLGKVLDRFPDNEHARKALAAALLKTGQSDRALTTLKPLLTAGSQNTDVWVLASEAALQGGHPAQARDYLQKAAADDPKNTRLRTALGVGLMMAGDAIRGVAELESVVAEDAEQTTAETLLILSYMDKREYDKALAALARLERKHPDDPTVHNFRGAIYAARKDIANARRSLERALAIQPNYKAALTNLAKLELQENNLAAARKHFEAVLVMDKSDVESMLALMRLESDEGKKITWLKRAVEANPAVLEPRILLAQYYLRKQQPAQALALAQEGVRLNPASRDAVDLLGTTQWENGEKDKALATFTQLATAMPPESAVAYYKLASVQAAMTDSDTTRASLTKALKLKPDYLPAQTALVWLEYNAGRPAEALKLAQRIQKQSPGLASGFMLEAKVLTAQEKHAEAAAAYEKALAIENSGPVAIEVHRARILAGNPQKADADLLQWLKSHDSPDARYHLAHAYLASGRHKLAIEQYSILLKKNPENVAVLNNLAGLYHQEKNPEALTWAEKAYKLSPGSPVVADTLGWILTEQGEVARGVELLHKAATGAPADLEIGYHYAVALAKAGEKVKARRQLEKLLAANGKFPQKAEARTLLDRL